MTGRRIVAPLIFGLFGVLAACNGYAAPTPEQTPALLTVKL